MSENLLSQSTRDVAAVRYFNCWRRDDEGSTEMPDPRDIGQALDAVCDHVERLEREIAKERDWHQQSKSAAMRVQQERDKLERELEQARQDAKQSDLDAIRALGERNDTRRTIRALRALVTSDFESKDDFIWRVNMTLDQPTPADD